MQDIFKVATEQMKKPVCKVQHMASYRIQTKPAMSWLRFLFVGCTVSVLHAISQISKTLKPQFRHSRDL